ncbi:MAG: hypothetical protein JRF33_22860, partial [Deltaproteobacteria bacterium]|nr:hypothetical protein [Deltaproteobacteria bacterium]
GWSVFRSGPEILIRSPLLALRAEHRLELRTRLVGDYRSLDTEAASLSLVIDPVRGTVSHDPPLTSAAREWLGFVPMPQGGTGLDDLDADEPIMGCATAGRTGHWCLLLVLGCLWVFRRRA